MGRHRIEYYYVRAMDTNYQQGVFEHTPLGLKEARKLKLKLTKEKKEKYYISEK